MVALRSNVVPRQTRLSDPAEGIESIAAALNLELQIYPLVDKQFAIENGQL
jgi:hypothetical protein